MTVYNIPELVDRESRMAGNPWFNDNKTKEDNNMTETKVPHTTAEYEKFVVDVWFSGDKLMEHDLRELFICTSGLGGECGEVQELIKKYVRDGKLDRNLLVKEFGDVLYYLTILTKAFGFTLEEVIQSNMDKLNGRIERGTLRGSGNDR